MRDIHAIVNKILVIIPDDFEGKDGLVKGLENIKESVIYSAPELMGTRWKELMELLQYSLGRPDIAWQKDIHFIMAGKDE
jgi:hypothetical protein